ncbi:hypothetical protein O7606_18510 [Micromonospora sp. WMMD882]|uniref:LppU/SCO3897 family protein n=1 Tax=Micromonospora sp. WMMD882 TaxID=3015151 RepID=UPI00248ACAA6|nr:hypothetical protein [Micromonospora sp. WMMD882]WBB78221.1 hypothetical protein O7606_18510 [Micromonospora sp. WMMD882]
MTSEGPHHPGQEPDEVSPGAGGSAPYGDRSAQQENGYGTAAPDLGWAPPPPAARPSSPAPAWGAPGETPPTVGWKSPGEQQQPGQWGPPPGSGQPYGGQGGQQQSGGWDPQADQQQPTTAWAAAQPQQQPWGQQDAPGGQQPAWGRPGDSAQQDWPGQGPAQPAWAAGPGAVPPGGQPTRGEQPARGQQQPTEPWSPSGAPPQAAPWGGDQPQGGSQWGGGQEQSSGAPWGAAPEQHQQPTAWGPPQSSPDRQPGWTPGNPGEQQPGWGPGGPGEQQPGARGSASVRPPGDPQPSAWGPGPQHSGQQSGPWGPADEQTSAPAWGAASVPAQQEQQRPDFDPPAGQSRPTESWPGADQSRPTESWPPAEPTSAPPARATASVRVESGPAWGATPDRPGDEPVPARPVVPEGEPWSADEVWGKAAPAPTDEAAGNPSWEPTRAENGPMYQPAPGPGISPANAVPLPPQETRVPGASLAASPPADYVPPSGYAEQGGYSEQGGQGGFEAEQRGDGWGGEPQAASAPVVPQPRTSPESAGAGEAGGSVTASASVPLSSRVTPPTDQALHPTAMPAPQPRVYGRPASPDQSDHSGGQQAEPHRFPHDGEPGGRFDGEPDPRFSGAAPGPRFDGPESRFDGPESRFDAPESRFDGPEAARFDAPEHRFNGPDAARFDRGPGNRFDERDQHDRPGGFGDVPAAAASAPPVPQPALPSFPPGMPAFADPVPSQRPVNGTRPHSEPNQPGDRFSGAAAPVSGGAVNGTVPGHGPGSADPTRGFPAAFPPGGDQPDRPLWDLGEPAGEANQGRFDAFKPEAETPKPAEPPTPKVRNGRVLAAVLTAAVLILVVPLGLLMLLGKIGGSDAPPAFNPAVGSCVKQSGAGAVAAGCGDEGAFKVVSRVDAKEKCADQAQPHVVLPGDAANRVLCLAPATTG